MKEETTRVEFECPVCGSCMFGSSDCHKEVMIRHCHGDEQRRCDFSFPSTDDWKYFVMRKVSHFESKVEFEGCPERFS